MRISSVNQSMAWMFLLSLTLLVVITLGNGIVLITTMILKISELQELSTLLSLMLSYSVFLVALLVIIPQELASETSFQRSDDEGYTKAKLNTNQVMPRLLFYAGFIFMLIFTIDLTYNLMTALFNDNDASTNQLLSQASNANPLYLVLLGIQILILGPVVEEIVYRVIPLFILTTNKKNRDRAASTQASKKQWLPLMTSAMTFSFAHLPSDLITNSPSYVISHQAYLLMLGILLGMSYLESRTLILPILLHAINNGISFTTITVNALFQWETPSSVFFLISGILLSLSGFIWWKITSKTPKEELPFPSTASWTNKGKRRNETKKFDFHWNWLLLLFLFGPGFGTSILAMSSSNLLITFLGMVLFTLMFLACFFLAVRHA